MDVPVWHASLRQLEKDGKVAVVAIVQDQHPDRARLFLQWKQIGWPTLADSLDLLNLETVPLTVAIDEYGIVRFSELPMSAAKTIEQTFVNRTYPKAAALPPADMPDLSALRATNGTIWSGGSARLGIHEYPFLTSCVVKRTPSLLAFGRLISRHEDRDEGDGSASASTLRKLHDVRV